MVKDMKEKRKIRQANYFSFFKDFQTPLYKIQHFSKPLRRNFVFKHFFSYSRISTHPALPVTGQSYPEPSGHQNQSFISWFGFYSNQSRLTQLELT